MKKSELTKFLTMLVAAYPHANMSEETIVVYETMLSDLFARDVGEVVLEHIATRKWFPTVSEIRESVLDRYHTFPSASEEFEKLLGHTMGLSDVGRRALSACGGHHSWRTTTNPTEWKREFRRTYDELVAKEKAAIRDASVKRLIKNLPTRMLNG